MRKYDEHGIWRQIQGRHHPHWFILTLDERPKNNSHDVKLITQLQQQNHIAKQIRRDNRKRHTMP